VNQLLIQYSYLQVLDFLTTVAFLISGVQEANPLVRFVLNYGPDPLGGLLAVKIMAVGLGLFCWWKGRQRLLKRINMMFAGVVAWNLTALILAKT
jgi:hypothetical protein